MLEFIFCALSLSLSLSLCDSENEVWFYEVPLQPMLYQDEVMRVSEGRDDAQVGNMFRVTVTETNFLDPEYFCALPLTQGHNKPSICLQLIQHLIGYMQ